MPGILDRRKWRGGLTLPQVSYHQALPQQLEHQTPPLYDLSWSQTRGQMCGAWHNCVVGKHRAGVGVRGRCRGAEGCVWWLTAHAEGPVICLGIQAATFVIPSYFTPISLMLGN